jgi:hypothetical protein
VEGARRMESEREKDEFMRIEAAQELEKTRCMVEQYVDHQAFWQAKIEEKQYKLGRLDERLGAGR